MNLELLRGDITKIEVDAIVNAANTSLLGGGGVDGAIHRAGGEQILEDCLKIRQVQGGCKTGQSVITRSGKLPCKKVIHTVGPVFNNGGEKKIQQLRDCYVNSIELLLDSGLSSIAFPNISTGIYKFPKNLAAQTAIEAIEPYLNHPKLDKLAFVCFDEENFLIYKQVTQKYDIKIIP